MPDKSTSEDLISRDVWFLYFLWKKGGFNGTIVELSRILGYRNDSPLNKRINRLKETGYIVETYTSTGPHYKITRKGEKKIFFLVYPKWFILIVTGLSSGYIFWGIAWPLDILPVEIDLLLPMGILSLVCMVVLLWMQRLAEKEIFQSISTNVAE